MFGVQSVPREDWPKPGQELHAYDALAWLEANAEWCATRLVHAPYADARFLLSLRILMEYTDRLAKSGDGRLVDPAQARADLVHQLSEVGRYVYLRPPPVKLVHVVRDEGEERAAARIHALVNLLTLAPQAGK